MCRTRPLIAALFVCLCAPLTAQTWVDLLLDENAPVPQVKAAFDAHWAGRPYSRSKGWKQFQRWYWFNEQRTWPHGERMRPDVLLQATEEMRSMRNQRSGARDEAVWEPLGPTTWTSTSYNPGNGRVNCVFADPSNNSTLYAGTPSAGVWRSTDGGNTWSTLFTDLPSMGVSGVAIDTTGTGTIYIATGDGDASDTYSAGVLKSTDDGSTWITTGLNWNITQSRTTRALRMHPDDPLEMYCAASNGLFRTTDGAETWQQVVIGSFRDVEYMPGDTTLVYACTDQLYRSVPGGAGFTGSGITGLPTSAQVGRMAIAVTPADPLTVYVLCSNEEDNGFLGLYRSTDGGSNFFQVSNSPNLFGYEQDGSDSGGQAWYDMALAADPEDANTVYVGGINVWKSTNGGSDWEIISHWVFPSDIGYTHADIHSLDFIGTTLYCGSDGGLHRSDDDAGAWTDLSAGMNIMQLYRMGGSEILPELLMAGAQDNGMNRYNNGSWTHVLGADGMEGAVDPFDPAIVYGAFQNGGLSRSDNGGTDWTDITSGITEEGPWVTPYALDPTMPGRMISGFNNVWASDVRGDSWYQLTNWSDQESVRCLTIAPSDGSTIYAARADLVQRSSDGGFTWTDIRAGLPNLVPTSFAVNDEDPLHVWISFSGTTATRKVYESFDGGSSWTNRSLDLPNVPVNSVVMQPGSPNGIYAGTDIGVFYIDDYTPDWLPYGTGLPNLVVSELEVNMTSGKLRAATYGSGVWQTDLFFSPFARVQEESGHGTPRVHPLDMHGRFMVRCGTEDGALRTVMVSDAMGRRTALVQVSGNSAEVDLSTQAPGAYVVSIITDKGTWSQRVVR